jgi:hypothetical protein
LLAAFTNTTGSLGNVWVCYDVTHTHTHILTHSLTHSTSDALDLLLQVHSACFHEWAKYVRKIVKSRRFLQKIAKGPMIQGWENWVLLMCVEGAWWEPGRELQEKLEEKCGRYALEAAYTSS